MAKRLAEFEKDPCGMNEDPPRGMCARPGICICACLKYINVDYDGDGNNDRSIPWSDTWFRRPWLQPAGYVAGTEACISGWEGHKNAQGQFVSCHLSALRFLHAVQQLARFTFVPPYCSSPPPHLLFLLLAPSLYPTLSSYERNLRAGMVRRANALAYSRRDHDDGRRNRIVDLPAAQDQAKDLADEAGAPPLAALFRDVLEGQQWGVQGVASSSSSSAGSRVGGRAYRESEGARGAATASAFNNVDITTTLLVQPIRLTSAPTSSSSHPSQSMRPSRPSSSRSARA